jgi:hypothetical protein
MKSFRLLLIALFLAVQVFSTLHMAHHGYAKHEHHGQVCAAYYYSEQAKSADVPAAILLPTPVFMETAPKGFLPAFLAWRGYEGARPRAPPAFLLS